MQLDLFKTEDEVLKEEVKKLRSEIANTRRGLFARHTEMSKEILQIKQELDLVRSFVGYKNRQAEILDLFKFG